MLVAASAAALAAGVAGISGRSDDLSLWGGVLMAATLLLALLGAGLSLRRRPVRLRWDSQDWYLTEARPLRAAEIGPLQVEVMIDLGSWLLLKVMSPGAPKRLAARWLPVQRRGIEDRWHALRCALYSPRAEAAQPVGLHGPHPH
jgi:hypothetical protein